MLADTSEIKLNGSKLPLDRPEAEYLNCGPEDSPIAIHVNLEAVDGIARDVLEGLGSTPRRDSEVGGLLLGRVAPGGNAVWIERFQRIPCEHSYGPHFILADQDTAALEDAAGRIFEAHEVAVVGLYRSHTRPGLQLEESDFELMKRYFSDASDVILLVKPGKGNNLFGQFYRFEPEGGCHPVGERFPFRGRVVTPDTRLMTPDIPKASGESTEDRERTRASVPPAGVRKENPDATPPRRLVPDFPSAPVEAAPSLFGLSDPPGSEHWRAAAEEPEAHKPSFLRKWLPLVCALALVGGVVWLLASQGRLSSPPATTGTAPVTADASRPLGLYVDPQPNRWFVSWNTNASSLRSARGIQLFVREGDDQQRVNLSQQQIAAGAYEYHPVGNDVTFRLEVADKDGRVSAESFRVLQKQIPAPVPPAAPQVAHAPAAPAPNETHLIQPKPVFRAPPVVAAGIRPRIKGSVPIDVRVHIDEHGKVVSATPVTKLHDGIEEYLGGRAVQAAKQWRFEPARENGKAVQGSQTIHFVFTK